MFPIEIKNNQKVMKISSGIHYIDTPLKITEDNLQIIGDANTILRGSLPLKNSTWHLLDDRIFYTNVEHTPDALYINDTKYRMARYPKYNPDITVFNGYSADCLSREKASQWRNPKGGYIHAIHKHHWGGFSYKITGKDADGNLTYIGGWQNNRQMGMHDEYRFVENIFEELTEPGEWYYSEEEQRIYVLPYPNHDLSTAEILVNSCFFDLQNCTGIIIKNITFERSARTFMFTKEPLLRSDWTIYRGGAVYFKDCKNCQITACTFEDIGSNAIFVDANSREIHIKNSQIQNIGASGICFVGRSDSVRNPLFEYGETNHLKELDLTPGPKSDNYPKNCSVDNCLISKVGMVEKQATGVEISMAYKISVTNCSIYDTSRAGLNISEGTFGGHLISGCDIFDTVNETGDHGSFNSWGRDRFWHLDGLRDEDAHAYALLDCIEPVVISHNRFRCDHGWDIDLDDGSSNYIISYNLCLNGGIKLREGCYRTVHHNIMVNNSVHMHAWYPNSGDIVQQNIMFYPYQTYSMPEGTWGNCIDSNYLYTTEDICVPANELTAHSGNDEHSLKLKIYFSNPDCGDYVVLSPNLPGFENFTFDFGVKYPPLQKISRQPIISPIELEQESELIHYNMHEIQVKNIDTDGEMSVYGTAGHNGVIVVSIPKNSSASYKGLQKGDVIISCEGVPINSVADFAKCQNIYSKKLAILRKQKYFEI